MFLQLLTLTVLFILPCIDARGSVWNYLVDKQNVGTFMSFPDYLYQHSYITVTIVCQSNKPNGQIRMQWIVQQMNCMEQMMNLQTENQQIILGNVIGSKKDQMESSECAPIDTDQYEVIRFQAGTAQNSTCGDKQYIVQLLDESHSPYTEAYFPKNKLDKVGERVDTEIHHCSKWGSPGRPRRDKVMVSKNRTEVRNTTKENRIMEVWEDGMYHFLLAVSAAEPGMEVNAKVRVEMGNRFGFIPANKWPLLPYSCVLAVVYLVLGTGWVVLWARGHQNTLKIHMVIGAITVSGALANTLLFVNMASLNSNGQIMESVLWLVELLAAVQDCLMNLLIMVVSTGYGITRPKLNKDILGIMLTLTMFNFLASVAIGVVIDEKLQIKYTYPMMSLVLMILYGMILLSIGAFIVGMSGTTLVHLWKRRHSANKRNIFAAFMVSSCVAFLVSVILIGVANGFYTTCRTDWKNEWLYANFGHMIGVCLLIGVMWLWRPVDSLQSYSFAPLATDDMTSMANLTDDEEVNGNSAKLAFNMEAL